MYTLRLSPTPGVAMNPVYFTNPQGDGDSFDPANDNCWRVLRGQRQYPCHPNWGPQRETRPRPLRTNRNRTLTTPSRRRIRLKFARSFPASGLTRTRWRIFVADRRLNISSPT